LADIGLAIIIFYLVLAIFAPQIASYDPTAINMNVALTNPEPQHIFGTDLLGRDIYSRVVWGSRVSFVVAFISVALAVTMGGPIGAIAGWFKGKPDRVIQSALDIWLAVPGLMLAMVIVGIFGGGVYNTTVAIALTNVPIFARLLREEVMRISELDYINAQKVLGFRPGYIMFRNVLPNALNSVVVVITFTLATAVLNEAALSFLGLGILPPTASWGGMLNELRVHLLDRPVLSIPPGLAILGMVLGFNFLGDGLRDALDPRLKV
jgi:peptide/nickel transport system permease protein